MDHKNCQVNITIDDKTYSIYYSYRSDSTFQDLLEYFAFLYPELNICQCYRFRTGGRGDRNFKISKIYNIVDYSDYLNNLKLYNNIGDKCAHTEENILLYSKLYIDSENIKKINNLRKLISKQNNIISENTKKIEEIEKKNMLLIQGVNGNVETLEFLERMNVVPKKSDNNGNGIVQNKNYNVLQIKQNIMLNNEKPKFADFYDVIVHIDSIKDINKGWNIEMNRRGEKKYNEFKNKPLLKIGIIGNANKGKSFLLSKISKIEFPSGMSIKTEGLSIKYPEINDLYKNRAIALLDSAGLETPVLLSDSESKKDKNELFREKSREKLITELFLQNYIVNNSDILIVVVDSVSFSEQKLLMKVKKEMERSKRFVPLYVIHNLKAYTSKKQVEDYIQETLLKSATFSLKRALILGVKIINKSGIHFYEDLNEKEKEKFPNIFHLIYANEYSDAGKIYNQYTLNFIEKTYQNITNLKEFDVIKTIKERYINISKDIIEKTENEKTLTEESFDNSDPKIIKLKNKNEIILKKCLIDELGFSNFKANGFEPKYNIYNKDKNKIIVRVEIPGNCDLNSEVEIHGEYNIIKLTGEKKKDIEPANLEENIYNLRENGKFVLEIPLKFAEYRLSNKKPVIKKKLGVCIIEYELDIYEKVETPISEEDIVVI